MAIHRTPCGHPMPHPLIISITFLPALTMMILQPRFSHGQQAYVNNNQLDCEKNFTNTNGFLCTGPQSSCTAYLTFRSNPPSYNTPVSIATLLNANATLFLDLNNISSIFTPLPADDLLIFPVNCSCTPGGDSKPKQSYYQHNVTYTLTDDDAYYLLANNTYQGLTTCQALMAQNPYNYLQLKPGLDVVVPLMCACPSAKQAAAGIKYLVSYLVNWNDDPSSIAEMFRVDEQSVLDANELFENSTIYPFTPLLVPLKSPLTTKINGPPPPPPPPPPPTTIAGTDAAAGSKRWVFLGIGIGGLVLVLALTALFLAWFCRHRSRKGPDTTPPGKDADDGRKIRSDDYAALYGSKSEGATPTSNSWSISTDGLRSAIESLTVYKYEELLIATDSFSEERRIKGSVFRGSFKGDDAAVKIVEGDASNEINILKKINHSNIIRLSGFCLRQGNTYLVYEYAEKGSLRDFIIDTRKDCDRDLPVLRWTQRVQIAHDMANALNYLHHYTNPPYIHKNFTSSSVLLDANLRAKITNFAFARTTDRDGEGANLTYHVVGTQGYLAPEYIENGLVTPKLDVFAFGMVLLELLSGKVVAAAGSLNNGGDGDEVLSPSLIRRVLEGENVREKLKNFIDGALGQEYPLELAYSMAQLAHSCVSHDHDSRPSMAEIFMALSKLHSFTLDWDPFDHSSSLSLQGH